MYYKKKRYYIGFIFTEVDIWALKKCALEEIIKFKKWVSRFEKDLTTESLAVLLFQNFASISKESMRGITGLSRQKINRARVNALENPDSSYIDQYINLIEEDRKEFEELRKKHREIQKPFVDDLEDKHIKVRNVDRRWELIDKDLKEFELKILNDFIIACKDKSSEKLVIFLNKDVSGSIDINTVDNIKSNSVEYLSISQEKD